MTVIEFLDALNTCDYKKPVIPIFDNIEVSLNKGDKKLFRSVETILDGYNYETLKCLDAYINRVTFMPLWDANDTMYWVKNVVECTNKVYVTLELPDAIL